MKNAILAIKSSTELRKFLLSIQDSVFKTSTPDNFETVKLLTLHAKGDSELFQILEEPEIMDKVSAQMLGVYFFSLILHRGGTPGISLYKYMADRISNPNEKFTAESLSRLLWSYSRHNVLPEKKTVQHIESSIMGQDDITVLDIGRILGFYSNFSNLGKEFEDFIFEKACLLVPKERILHPQTALGLSRSLTSLFFFDEHIWYHLIRFLNKVAQFSYKLDKTRFMSNHHQILQTIDSIQEFAPDLYSRHSSNIQDLTKRLKYSQSFIDRGERNTELADKFEQILREKQLTYSKSTVVEKYYAVDFLVQPNLIFEIDGPSHFIRSIYGHSTGQLTGRSIYKGLLLEKKGYQVARIPYYDLGKMP